ncbi:MAG: ribosomal RNA small subunit methyltransferase A [Methylotenera sp.]|nr:ribosomal RNA small subunit methyltransferase A [Oligoflexia bacterium]
MPAHGKRRAFGQHFLHNQKVITTIVEKTHELAKANGCKALLEVGPGKGAITHPLIERFQREPFIQELILAERDENFVNLWKHELPTKADADLMAYKIRVEAGDFVQAADTAFLGTLPLMVVSNLPYSAGTAIVTRLALHYDKIPAMVLMFQAEVAQRLRAVPSTKPWGSLSIWIQNRWDVEKLVGVPPGAFTPPPDVDSEVVVFRARKAPRVDVSPENEEKWEALLRVCFTHRRKMLRSGLPKTGPWQNALELSGLDGTKRSEALSWEEWQKFFQAVISVQ